MRPDARPSGRAELMRRNLAIAIPLALLSLVFAAPRPASAQRFGRLAESAEEVTRDLGHMAAPLLANCGALVGRSREICRETVERAARELRDQRWLLSVSGSGRVVLGPYEPRLGGFRVVVPGLEFVRPAGGVVSTRPRRDGELPDHSIAATFVRVPAGEARAWASRNAPERLRMRLVFEFGRSWEDARATRAERRRGITIDILGVQVFNESTGQVLIETTGGSARMPRAPDPLDRRRGLWTRRGSREVLWSTPDGDLILFHVREEEAPEPEGAVIPIVLMTRRAETEELTRFVADDRGASVDLLPHGPHQVLVVITERRTRGGRPGQGQVVLLRWNAARAEMRVVARWEGRNDQRPPEWVTDPSVPLPTESGAEGGGEDDGSDAEGQASGE